MASAGGGGDGDAPNETASSGTAATAARLAVAASMTLAASSWICFALVGHSNGGRSSSVCLRSTVSGTGVAQTSQVHSPSASLLLKTLVGMPVMDSLSTQQGQLGPSPARSCFPDMLKLVVSRLSERAGAACRRC